MIRYLNRLGDYLFVAARATSHAAGAVELPWEKPVS
jgi:cob(I)alamin adenosyltransferase